MGVQYIVCVRTELKVEPKSGLTHKRYFFAVLQPNRNRLRLVYRMNRSTRAFFNILCDIHNEQSNSNNNIR
jgi:hypothetical protein